MLWGRPFHTVSRPDFVNQESVRIALGRHFQQKSHKDEASLFPRVLSRASILSSWTPRSRNRQVIGNFNFFAC